MNNCIVKKISEIELDILLWLIFFLKKISENNDTKICRSSNGAQIFNGMHTFLAQSNDQHTSITTNKLPLLYGITAFRK